MFLQQREIQLKCQIRDSYLPRLFLRLDRLAAAVRAPQTHDSSSPLT
jgi:hypothetical protein